MESDDVVDVVFRIDREGVVFAMFPALPADNSGRYCTCYQHVGQHSSADYHGCINHSRPAKPKEYADLKRELEGRGYHLRVIQRASWRHFAKRMEELTHA